MTSPVLFSRKSDEWCTPQELYEELHAEFHFTLDGAATTANHKCDRWLGPGGLARDALTTTFRTLRSETIFINPPFSKVGEFVGWASHLRYGMNRIVLLIAARTDTRYWHRYIWDRRVHQWRPGVHGRFLKGRLTFVGAPQQAPFPSTVIVFEPLRHRKG